ncbi:22502_t:CDS:2, partial [Entrophospora sp. SA101]
MKVENNYLKITSPELWSLDGFVDWCGSYDIFKGDKVKILDHIKKGLEKVKNNVLINEGIRQKATKLFKDFQQTWRSSQTITEYFKQLEIRYQTKQKLEVIESQKTIELAEIERMKVTQLWNNTESVAKIHQHVSDSFVEFSKEMTRIPKRILESDRESNPDKKQKPSALEDSDDELIIIDDDEEINNLTKADVLFTVKEINKIIHTAGSNNICTTSLEDTPKQDKKKVIKIIKKANDSYPESPCPGSPGSP